MKPHAFEYRKPDTLASVLATLSEFGDEAQILAGGQSLVATLNMRLSAPRILVDVNGLRELDGIALEDRHLRIGALVRHAAVERSALIAEHAPLIARAAPHVAHTAIRNRGTFGGSIAFGDPAAEFPAVALAMAASIEIAGPEGQRTVAASDFYRGLYETALEPGEMVTAVLLPSAAGRACAFHEIARRHGDYAMVGLAAQLGATIDDVRLAYFGVGATPVRASAAEGALAAGSVDEAVQALKQDLDPPDDVEASGATRLHLAGVLLRRAAAELQGRTG